MSFIESFTTDEFLTMSIRIFIALTLSGLIGLERGLNNHSAGFRTHILVGIGSCLMMLLSLYGFEEFMTQYDNVRFDPARIPSYVISGIGFLGAGTIIVNGMAIRGLTTAASIWTVAGLGLVVGAGMYNIAILTTVVILLSLVFLNNFENRFKKRRNSFALHVLVKDDLKMEDLLEVLSTYNVLIKKLQIGEEGQDERALMLELGNLRGVDKSKLVKDIADLEDIIEVNEKF